MSSNNSPDLCSLFLDLRLCHGRSFSTGRSLQWDPTSQGMVAIVILMLNLTVGLNYFEVYADVAFAFVRALTTKVHTFPKHCFFLCV